MSERKALPLPDRPWPFFRRVVMDTAPRRGALMVGFTIAAQGTEALIPWALASLSGLLVVAAAGGAVDLPAITLWCAAFAVIVLAQALLFRAAEAVETRMAPLLQARVQARLYDHLMGHAPRYFEAHFAGQLSQKVKAAGLAVVHLVEVTLFEAVRITVLLAVSFTLLALESAELALIFGLWSAGFIALSAVLARRCQRLAHDFAEAGSTLSGRMVDSVSNASLVRSFARHRHEKLVIGEVISREHDSGVRLRLFINTMHILQAIGMWVLYAALVSLAAWEVVRGEAGVEAFVLTATMGGLIQANVQYVSHRILLFFEQQGVLEEALEQLMVPHDITDAPDAPDLVVARGAIEIQGLHYHHADGTVVFEDLDLSIAAGEKVGLVGPSGAGKSTLVKLIRRHFEPQAGRVRIDGQDITQVRWDSLNEAIAEVPQSPGIFHRPIRENIRYARPDADQAAVEAAARAAHCHEFVAKRADGYDTVVGEQGVRLSGGERQRVAIARAILKDAPILILDEATASLDSESEALIQDALWTAMRGRTVIAIAHRLGTVQGMDRILYLEAGRVVEEGPHADLLARGGRYARLWATQFAAA